MASLANTFTPGSNGLSRLRELQLASNAAGDAGISSLSAALTRLHAQAGPLQLRRMTLGSNDMTGQGLAKLCDSLCAGSCPHLEELGLSTNPLGSQAAPHLARLLQSPRLPSLSDLGLSACLLDGNTVRQVVAVLSQGPAAAAALVRVDMEGNQVDEEARAAVANFLEANRVEGHCPVLTACTV